VVRAALPRARGRLLRLLASHGVFAERAARCFALNDAARALLPPQPGGPPSVRAQVLWLADPMHHRIYADVMHSVRTGAPAVAHVLGAPIFQHLQADAAEGRVFNDAMSAMSDAAVPGVLSAYDFGACHKVLCDVGGGHGAMLSAVLNAHPALRGILFDLPHVVADAPLRALGVAERCLAHGGDFFAADAMPRGADAFMLKHIVHDWDDDRAAAILGNVAAALRAGGGVPDAAKRVLLLEHVLPERGAAEAAPSFTHIIDLEMLVVAGGRERTAAEFEALLRRAGLALVRVLPTPTDLCVIEARLADAAV
jgi:hypothetical protein